MIYMQYQEVITSWRFNLSHTEVVDDLIGNIRRDIEYFQVILMYIMLGLVGGTVIWVPLTFISLES